MSMSLNFVRAMFRMETGHTAVRVSQISFNTFMIEADNGQTYTYRA